MMYTLGKTIHTTVRAAIAVIVLFAFASCVNPLTDVAPDKTPDAPVVAAPNCVTLSIAVKLDASRIVLPDASPLASYRLFGSFAGGALAELGTWTSLSAATVTVASGEWDFTLDGYDGDGVLILTGSIDDRTVTDGTTLSFSLRDIESGTGSVSVNLLWPYADNLVTSVTAIFDETTTTLTRGAAPSGEFMVTYSDASVAAGDYLLTFRMLDSDGMTVATVTEWVLVRKDLASKKDIALASTDLNYVPASPSTIVITKGELGWSSLPLTIAWFDNADNETGFRVESSEDGETWKLAANVGAGVTTYGTSLLRGETRSYRISAFNDFGVSEPAIKDYDAQPLIDFMTSDSSIMSVTVNLWDPDTLAFHGTFELTRCGDFFKGGGEPTELGPQLIQAYAYDAAGKLRGVAEVATAITKIDDYVSITNQSARLMGGNVQKTGVTLNEMPVVVSPSDINVTSDRTGQMISDGLNLYISDSFNNCLKRQVISSKATAIFAGAGAGFDEDNPGQSPDFSEFSPCGLTTDGKFIYLGGMGFPRIYRLNFAASTKLLIEFPYNADYPNDDPTSIGLVTDGTYLYVADNRPIHRLNLSTLELTHLDPSDWTWKAHSTSDWAVRGGLTMSGSKLFWYNSSANTMFAMSFEGGDAAAVAASSSGFDGNATTDGNSLFIYTYDSDVYTISHLDKIVLSTGAVTRLGDFTAAAFSRLIATDGVNLYILAN